MSSTISLPSSPAVRWDLSALYSGLEDPKIEALWDAMNTAADAFASKYRGAIAREDITAEFLAGAIGEYEHILNESSKPGNYASLLFSVETNNPEIGAFMQEQQERSSEIRVKLVFFDLELQKIPESRYQAIRGEAALAQFTHFLDVVRAATPYMLSEEQETLLEEVANTGSRAWVRLFDEVTSNHVYKYTAPGTTEPVDKNESELLAMLRSADRAERTAAADAFSAGLGELSHILTYTYNNLLADKKLEDRLRKRPYAEHSRHTANELDKETVDLVMQLCKENQHLVSRYYHVKRNILGLPELTHVDRYAPLFEGKDVVEWEEGKQKVLNAFGKFSEPMRVAAEEFFTKNWIDAEVRPGKSGGAFCSYVTPDLHPVVMVNYFNKLDDVMTLAHELGHGVHASLSRAQSLVNFHGTLPLAELASIFGEMLVFEDLVGSASHRDRLALYAEKIEGIFATVFRQAAMFRFEQRAHEARRTEGELTAEELGDIWQDELQSMFGDSVKMGDQHRAWWSYVGHFVFAPFYVYAYSFGELLTLSLYQSAKDAGPEFADNYLEVLRLGGSKTPFELMDMLGVDLRSRDFWLGGFAAIEKMVATFEDLWANNPA